MMTETFFEYLIAEMLYLMAIVLIATKVGNYQEQEKSVIPDIEMPKEELVINCMFIKLINIKIEQINSSIEFLSEDERVKLEEEVLTTDKALRKILSCSNETKFNMKERVEGRLIETIKKIKENYDKTESRKQRKETITK